MPMTRTRLTYRFTNLLLTLGVTVLLSACDDSSGSSQSTATLKEHEVHLMPCTQNYSDITAIVTRALPTGYVLYNDLPLRMPANRTRIRGYVTYDTKVDFMGDFVYAESEGIGSWSSKIPLDEKQYYIYGFMPGNDYRKVSINAPSGKTYADGAVMTISGLDAVTTDDPCVIVGVKGWKNNSTHINNIPLTLGQFTYEAEEDGQYVYLLIDHLYAALRLSFDVNTNYNALRTIKLTKMTITAEAADLSQTVSSVDMTATLTTGNETQPLAIELTPKTGTAATVTVYNGEELTLSDTNKQDFLVCIAPHIADGLNRRFRLATTYNVYDRKGNLVRESQTAENVLTIPSTKSLSAGQMYTFNLTVNPTYLYMLSDPDLDSPTLQVN